MTDKENNDSSDYANGEYLNVSITSDDPIPGETPADPIIVVSEDDK